MSEKLLKDIEDLLEVGASVWLEHKAATVADAADQTALGEHRAGRRSRLAKIEGHMRRVAEVDAQIALLRVSEGVPRREICLRNLENLRRDLLRQKSGT